jgi:hypothetical protein
VKKISIIGGGIIGALEAYYAYQDAQKRGEKICITIYEKGLSFDLPNQGQSSTNTAYNTVASLTIDEIFCVIPNRSELVEKLGIHFSEPGGIRVDDVAGVNDSQSAIQFKKSVAIYNSDNNHDDRTLCLLMLGKKSMSLWQQMYDEGNAELKALLKSSNFNPCREPQTPCQKVLHDGYRVDLIYGMLNAKDHALKMKADYERLGYQHCALLSPDEVIAIDPYLADFCQEHSARDAQGNRIWKPDSVALWRPGGCIDIRSLLPKLYAYLKKRMGHYQDAQGELQECFQLQFGREVTMVEFDSSAKDVRIQGLVFRDGTRHFDASGTDSKYIFCPGEAVGTLHKLGFHEPAYAAFAGPSLLITIPLTEDLIEKHKNFSHYMEIHIEGIVLAWQARFKDNAIFIGGAGTKSFYGDKQPHKDEDFAKNRNLVQLNMMNTVLPEFLSLAYGYNTQGKKLTAQELSALEEKGMAQRWVGRRALAYDGFPTLGPLYANNRKVTNARCTTHLGSGGVSVGPGAVFISRSSEHNTNDAFVQKILMYADSRRIAE